MARSLVAVCIAVLGAGSAAAEPDAANVRAFVVGDYVVVGQGWNQGPAYAGAARISEDGAGLKLERRVGGATETAKGEVDLSGEGGPKLRFAWGEGEGAATLTCLFQGDPDNYARLTCIALPASGEAATPGVEAMFPTGGWPDETPGKAYEAAR